MNIMNWQPIETAPLDKRILVVANRKVHIAYWEQDDYATRPRPYWRIEEFQQTMMSRTADVTHWMDIPDIETSDEAAPRHGVALEPLVRRLRLLESDHTPGGYPAVQMRDISRILDALEFYRRRCDLLQANQRRMRDPERTMVCDILANGALLPDPTGERYG